MNTTIWVTLEEVRCYKCGLTFAIDAKHVAQLRRSHDGFYCPNGHEQYFTAKSEAEKARDEVVAIRAQLDRARADADWQREQKEYRTRQLTAAKGRVTRIRNRCLKGLCTCCGKEFPDLAAHMQAEHPDAATRED